MLGGLKPPRVHQQVFQQSYLLCLTTVAVKGLLQSEEFQREIPDVDD